MRMRRRWLRGGVVMLALAGAGAWALAAGAEERGDATSREVRLELPPRPLGEALQAVGEAAGLEIQYAPAVDAASLAPALSGTMTVEAALRRLLAGRGLDYRVIDARTVLVAPVVAGTPPIEFDPVTVLGSRRPGAPLSNVPASISIVEEPAIQQELATTSRIEDVLKRQVPGFNPTNEGVRLIRGRTAQVFINGVPVNEQLRASSGNDLTLLLPEQLSRIEVARGASAAYGFGSPGGIIGLTTPRARSAELTLRTEISNSFNTGHPDDSHRAVLYQSASQIRGAFDYHLGAAVGYDGLEYAPNGQLALGFDNAALLTNGAEMLHSADTSLGLDLEDLGRLRLSATFNHVDFLATYGLVEGVYRERFGRLEREPKGEDSFRTAYTVALAWEHDDVLGHAVKIEGFRSDTRIEIVRRAFGTDRRERDEQDNEYSGVRSSATLPLARVVGGWFDGLIAGAAVTYGVDYIRNHYARPVFFTDTGELQGWFSPPVTLVSYAPYVQLELPLGDRVRLTGGVRHEIYDGHVESTRGGFGAIRGGDLDSFALTLFNAGAVLRLARGLDLYATFAQGAEITQLGRAALEVTSADQLDLEPAKSNQYELGVRGYWRSLALALAGFYTESDLLSALDCSDVLRPCRPLREPREFWGIEASTDWTITPEWSIGAVLAWMDGFRDPEGGGRRRIGSREVPPLLVTSYVEYRPWTWWRNRVQLDYRGARDPFGDSTAFGEGRVDELLLVNVAVAFDVGRGTLAIGVENLLDEQYTSIPAEAGNIGFTWLPEEGRRLKVSYSVRW